VSIVYDWGPGSPRFGGDSFSPVHPALDGATAVDRGADVRDGTPHATDLRVPCVVELAIELDLDDLTASVVDVRANDKTFLSALDTVADSNNVAGHNNILLFGRHYR